MNRTRFLVDLPAKTSDFKTRLNWKFDDSNEKRHEYLAPLIDKLMYVRIHGHVVDGWVVSIVALNPIDKNMATMVRQDGFGNVSEAKEYCGELLPAFFKDLRRFMP